MEYCSTTEKAIINRVIADALKTGHVISVYDGEEFAIKKSADAEAIRKEVAATDETTFTFHAADGSKVGWVWFVHGNECDVISDYGVSPIVEKILEGATALAETF
jgi:hypothetical protein